MGQALWHAGSRCGDTEISKMRCRPRGTAAWRRGSYTTRSRRGKSAHGSLNQRIPEDVMLGQVLQARGGAWSESGEVEAPGAGRRGMAVVGTTEKEPRVLVASSAGQEPAWGGGPWLQKPPKRLGLSPVLGCSPCGGCVAPCAEPDFGVFYLLRWTGPGDQLHPGYEGQAGPGDLARALPGAPPRTTFKSLRTGGGRAWNGLRVDLPGTSSSPWKCEGSGQSTDM